MAKKGSTVITLPQMVDLALNSPEIGIVNFTVLHSLLHVIVQQLELSECSVEFRGSDSDRLQNYISTAKPGPIITLTEYTVGQDGQEKKAIRKKRKQYEQNRDKSVLRIVVGMADEKGQADAAQSEKDSKSLQTVVVVEQSSKVDQTESPHFSVAVTQDHYDHLMGDIDELKEKVLELSELPANIGLVEALRAAGKDKPSPVLDMFHILTLNKRMDAAEQGMEKLGTIIEDLAKEAKGEGPLVHATATVDPEALKGLEERITNLENVIGDGNIIINQPSEPGEEQPADTEPSLLKQSIGSGIDLLGIKLSETPIAEAMDIIQSELQRLRRICGSEFMQTIKDLEALKNAMNSDDAPPEVRITQVEIQLNAVLEQIASLDTMYNNQIAILNEKVMSGGEDKVDRNEQAEVEIYNKLTALNDEIHNVEDTVQKLWEEREGRQALLDVIEETLDILKLQKCDKEDVEEALADKADVCLVNRKVSNDIFDEVIEKINEKIDDIYEKLAIQNELWTAQATEFAEELKNKTNNWELQELRAYIDENLSILSAKIQKLAEMKDDIEAAGAKSKFLRNVNCISCDTKVVMRKEFDPSAFPKSSGMPNPGKSMGPYLAYELDQMRKSQKCFGDKNKQKLLQQTITTGRSDKSEDQFCNRYCGGSHTTTTPMQRVTRGGHFLEQWGPEISPVVDETIRGTDGKMYKGRDDAKLKTLLNQPKEKPVEVKKEDSGENKASTLGNLVAIAEAERASVTSAPTEAQRSKQSLARQSKGSERKSAGSKQSIKDAPAEPEPQLDQAPPQEVELTSTIPDEAPPAEVEAPPEAAAPVEAEAPSEPATEENEQ
ncbi:unnamed protein product [Brassicogethes aeneus]|uniref:DUF4795 domain-containing protein n=1 Tax=Brassicogethes aeneus TaxID=1431903 RepID=A0A9P0FR09_BRAAE|nr:unnamed protein product [Brassicogethes aeneus]